MDRGAVGPQQQRQEAPLVELSIAARHTAAVGVEQRGVRVERARRGHQHRPNDEENGQSSKTEALFVSRGTSHTTGRIKFMNHPIHFLSSHKHLGLWINEKLDKHVCWKESKQIFLFRKCFSCVTETCSFVFTNLLPHSE